MFVPYFGLLGTHSHTSEGKIPDFYWGFKRYTFTHDKSKIVSLIYIYIGEFQELKINMPTHNS